MTRRPPAPETVRLAEFAELRNQIEQRGARQQSLIALNLAAIGTVIGFVAEGASTALLLIVSLVAPMFGLLWLDHHSNIHRAATYVRRELWLWDPSWERYVVDHQQPRWWAVLYWAAHLLIFFGAAVAALVIAFPGASGPAGEWIAWSFGALLTLAYSAMFAHALRSARWR